jgi:hypothetical protein
MEVIFNIGQLMCYVIDILDGECINLDIQKRTFQRKRFWKGAEEILAAKYLQKVGIVKSDVNSIDIRGICIRVSNPGPKNEPFVINFSFTRNNNENEITCGNCNCTAGNLAKCKHAVALLLYLTKYVYECTYYLFYKIEM